MQAPHNLSVAVLAHGWYSVCCAREGCALSPLELRARWGTGVVRILILLDVRVVRVWVERALGKPPAKPSRLTSTGISCHKEFLNPAALCAAKKKAEALVRVDRTRAVLNTARDGNVRDAKRATAAAVVRAEAAKDKTLSGARWRQYRLDDTVAESRRLALTGVRDLSPWMVQQLTRMRSCVFNTYQRLG